MSRTLYVFVDESGSVSNDEYYVVGACWCLSEESLFTAVLDPTVQRLSDIAESTFHSNKTIGELHATDLPKEVLHNVVSSLSSELYSDDTAIHGRSPWDADLPIRFSHSMVNPAAGSDAIEDIVGNETDTPRVLKTVSLLSALDPLFRPDQIDPDQYDSIDIVLDADTWKNPAQAVEATFRGYSEQPTPSFETEDSVRTPGLQIADLWVYTWCRQQRTGNCSDLISSVRHYQF